MKDSGEQNRQGGEVRNYDRSRFNICDNVLIKYDGDLEEVEIPYGVTEIADAALQYAFEDICSEEDDVRRHAGSLNLKRVTIPPTVKTIGKDAFFACGDLQRVVIPKSVTKIKGNLFAFCNALKSVTVEEDNPVYHSAGDCIIETKQKLLVCGCGKSKIPADGSVRKIAPRAFISTLLCSAYIPAGVTEIGNQAFSNTGVVYARVPSTVEKIPEEAFYRCYNLNEVSLESGLKSIGERAFYNCRDLKEMIFPYGLTSIGARAFYECTALEKAELPSNLMELGDAAFYGCASLKSVKIPKGIKKINRSTFFRSGIKSLVLEDGVEEIAPHAFSCCRNLKDVTLPESLKTIGYNAFAFCTSLENIFIPKSVEKIRHSCFASCNRLKNVYLPKTAEVGNKAFALCNEDLKVTYY